ncbi:MAG: prenyltransferase/squalene oxidase repeat-containing protein, partial [Patescibacteria group bacterium]
YPFSSIDQSILSGGENVYIYFGSQTKILLSSSDISTNDTLTVTTQNYDYENNSWTTRTGVTVGLTQPNPSDPFSPTEVTTSAVDANGQAMFPSITAGSYNVGVKEDYYFPTEPLTITTPAPVSSGGGSSSSNSSANKAGEVLGATTKLKFDVAKAFEFLISQQKDDGSFGEDMYTDWAAITLASGNHTQATIKLIKYLNEHKPAGDLLTDYERHAMALMAVGLNPYNTNGLNYIEKITSAFDGKQFGDIKEDNDDIFALLVLKNAGFSLEDNMVKESMNFVLSRQKENGSWDGSIDMTGATIQILSTLDSGENTKKAIEKGKEFLKKSQKEDGGFGNVSSTAWAIEGIIGLNEKPEDWKKGELTPLDYLASKQDTDGGIKEENLKNKIWQTTYTIKSYSGKTWGETLQKFEKPTTPVVNKVVKEIPKKKIAVNKILTATPIKAIDDKPALPLVEPVSITEEKPVEKSWFSKILGFLF